MSDWAITTDTASRVKVGLYWVAYSPPICAIRVHV